MLLPGWRSYKELQQRRWLIVHHHSRLAALLEWILWLLAFLYCLAKVYQKANGEGRWGIKVLAVLNMIFFTAMRCIFLPIMVVTLPLPPQMVRYFPTGMIGILQWFAFWTVRILSNSTTVCGKY